MPQFFARDERAGLPQAAYVAPESLLVFDHLTRRVALLHAGDERERQALRKDVVRALRGGLDAPDRPGKFSPAEASMTVREHAASVLKGHKVKAPRVMVVPGSHIVKDQTESEGLHTIFKEAGCEWREPGCSMCLAMNGDMLQPGQYCVSTSNRNFEGRQGPGGRTMLASPLTAAASAIEGKVADARRYV